MDRKNTRDGLNNRKRMEQAFVDAVLHYRTPVVLALGVGRDEETGTALAVSCAEATGRYRLQAARMLAALLPEDMLDRSVEAAEAQEHQDRAQAASRVN